jgi:D-alanine-D-alanine ligase-like ATP-grasp enzyme
MPRSIAILVKDENDAAQGFLQAFAQQGNEVTCIVCNELLPVALQMAKPDFAIVAGGDVWGEPGSAQLLLAAMGIPQLGADANTIALCRDAAQLQGVIGQAIELERIEAQGLGHIVLDRACLDALAQTGQVEVVEKALGEAWPLVVRGNDADLLDSGTVAHDRKELNEALAAAKAQHDKLIVYPQVDGVEMLVAIMGDLNDVLVLPPVELGERADDADSWTAPVVLSHLSGDEQAAQDIRSEVERCALDAFIACGCSDWACVRLVWDGGRTRILGVDAAPSLKADGALAFALKAADIDLPELANEFCEIADERAL